MVISETVSDRIEAAFELHFHWVRRINLSPNRHFIENTHQEFSSRVRAYDVSGFDGRRPVDSPEFLHATAVGLGQLVPNGKPGH